MKEGNVMKKLNLKKRKGGALVFTLLVMMIMTILGTTLLQISLAENKQAIREKNRIEAYYLARSGVEATAKWMLDTSNVDEVKNILGQKSQKNNQIGNGEFEVEVLQDSLGTIIIEGTGVVNGVESKARMSLNQTTITGEKPSFKYAIYTTDSFNAHGNVTVSGSSSVGYGGTYSTYGNVSISNPKPDTMYYPAPEIPKYTSSQGNLTVGSNTIINLSSSSLDTIKYDNINLGSGTNTLTINTGNTGKEVNVIVENLNFEGNHQDSINISGNGKVNFYILGNAVINADVNYGKGPEKLFFLMPGSGSFTLKNNGNHSIFNAYIYAPLASFINTGNSNITGAMIFKSVNLGGTPFTGAYNFNGGDIGIDVPSTTLYSKGVWLD